MLKHYIHDLKSKIQTEASHKGISGVQLLSTSY